MTVENQLAPHAVLEQFKESHPEMSLMKISQLREEEFVQRYANQLNGGEREAKQIYRTAVNLWDKAVLVWGNIKDAVSPYFKQTLFNNLPQDLPQAFIQQQEQIPKYSRLFGSLDFIDCDHYRSIFGPAAYFVDLMRFVEKNITQPNSIPAQCKLEDRRPDFARIQLDADNTSEMIPYIDLVNELLEVFIRTTADVDRDTYEIVKDEIFPMQLPLNLPLIEIRSYLQQLKTSLSQIYKTFQNKQLESKDQSPINREVLELSPEDFSLIISAISHPADLSKSYGGVPLAGSTGLENVDVFLEQTGLNRQQLNDLIFQDLDRHEINAGLSRLFFINNVEDGLGYLTIAPAPVSSQAAQPAYDTLQNLSPAKLDRIYRFLRLARKLDWSFAELDWALRSLGKPDLAEKALRFDGINDYVACRNVAQLNAPFTIEAWISPERPGRNIILCKGEAASQQIHFMLWINRENQLAFYASRANDKQLKLTSAYLIPTDVFTHVAVTVEQGFVRLYVNGQPDRADSITQDRITAIGTDFNIGRDLGDGTFAGVIKDVRLWSVARPPDAIADYRYRRLTGQENNLISYWTLTENIGDKLIDRSPSGNHGVIGATGLVTQPEWVRRNLILDPLYEGKGYQFNGNDQYLATVLKTSAVPITQLTLEAWVKLEASQDNPILVQGNEQTQQFQYALRINAANQVVFESSSLTKAYESTQTVTTQVLTHIAIVLDGQTLKFYVNGTKDATDHSLTNFTGLAPQGQNLQVGKSFDRQYFKGIIREIRIWHQARSIDQLVSYLYRPVTTGTAGLWGYWRLDSLENGQAPDLSAEHQPLYLGGTPASYIPQLVRMPSYLLPTPPIATPGTALQLDGDNDVLIIRNTKNWGLGRFDEWTLEFWFNATQPQLAERQQIILTQGDREAGLSIYLFQNRLYLLQWNSNLAGTDLTRRSIFSTEFTQYNQWHHLALTNTEFPDRTTKPLPLGPIEFRAYLDGTALQQNGAEVATGFCLSPVGVLCLGGLAKGSITRLGDDYTPENTEERYFFAGQLANLRLWKTARTLAEIQRDRFVAPPLSEDLLAYLPLNRGEGWLLQDPRTQIPQKNRFQATLQQHNIALNTTQTQPELANLYSHYTKPAALTWKNYYYAGRMRIIDANAAIGVTVFSRYPENINQFYRLGRSANQPQFRLTAHPEGVQSLKAATGSTLVSAIQPEANLWYRFLIWVQDTGNQTNIKAKIWPEGEAEPTDFAIDAYDDDPDIRIKAGTVGVWTTGNSTNARQFDNLRVWSEATANPTPAEFWLDLNFEAPTQMPEPELWQDRGDRIKPLGSDRLFRSLVIGGTPRQAAGTDSPDRIHSHYTPPSLDVLTWTNYIYEGRCRITDPDSGIGVTFFSRYPDSIDQYYSLGRDRDRPTFQLIAHPQQVQSLKSTSLQRDRRDSGIIPRPNIWYRFSVWIRSNDGNNRTEIRVKLWEEGTIEPAGFQMEAYDDSGIRIRSGTVGVWAAGSGVKYFDQLWVTRTVLLSEQFETYTVNQDPLSWRDTRENGSREENNALFKTFQVDGSIAFGTTSELDTIHSHYTGAGALNWSNYIYTGRLSIAETDGGIGVTFFSRYSDPTATGNKHDSYYCLRRVGRGRLQGTSFYLSARREGSRVDEVIKGEKRDSRLIPLKNTWYRFRIEVEDTSNRTNIRVKIWQEGTPEPTDYQIEAYDDAANRLRAGTVGVWTSLVGAKYFDDLRVFRGSSLPELTAPQNWTETPSRNRYEVDETLFKAIDTQENQLHWVSTHSYPLLLNPLSRTALQFDGKRHYLAATNVQGIDLSHTQENLVQLTIEAWVCPDQAVAPNQAVRRSPMITLAGTDANQNRTKFWFGLVSDQDRGPLVFARLQEDLFSTAPVTLQQMVGQWTHLAVTIRDTKVTFFVNGKKQQERLLSVPLTLKVTDLEIGRNLEDLYFAGQIKEVRIWNTVRTEAELETGLYQRPAPSTALVGYWALGEDQGKEAIDRSRTQPDQRNNLRLGGIPNARQPVLLSLNPPDAGFWRSDRKVLFLKGNQTVRYGGSNSPQICQQHTIEVWFQVTDKTISQHKQVIYQEGDAQRGLVLYVYDSELYFVGYNTPAGESDWQIENESNWRVRETDSQRVWRLKTARIESGKWHHAAIVLDGRGEVRPGALKGYLDGKFVGAGEGSQLWEHRDSFCLGGVPHPIRFHDGASTDQARHYLTGRILQLRIWDGVRTTDEIAAGWSDDLQGNQTNLALVWDFNRARDTQIPDTSGNHRNGSFDRPAQLETIQNSLQAFPAYALNPVSLDAVALDGISEIKRLKEQHNLSIDRLTALWFPLKHTGQADQNTLFDQVFNGVGLNTEQWSYYLDQPIRWDRTGQENSNRDRQIRSRLMGALQVSSAELDAIVTHISDTETILELDTTYLTQLYQWARLSRLLGLSVEECLSLVEFMGQPTVQSPMDVMRLSERAAWMQQNQISGADLAVFARPIETDPTLFYSESALRTLAQSLNEQIKTILINGESFTATHISQARSLWIFQLLKDRNLLEVINSDELTGLSQIQQRIKALAALKQSSSGVINLADLLEYLAAQENWATAFDPLKEELKRVHAQLGNFVWEKLLTQGFINNTGLLRSDHPAWTDENLLQLLPPAAQNQQSYRQTLPRIRAVLEQREDLQKQIEDTVKETLERSQIALPEAIRQAFATMFGVSTDLIQVVIDYLQQHPKQNSMTQVQLIQQIYSLREKKAPIPLDLSLYLAKLVKLLYLLAKFELNPVEAEQFLQKPEMLFKQDTVQDVFSLSDLLQPTLANLDRLSQFKQLKTSFPSEANSIDEVTGVDEPNSALLTLLSQWVDDLPDRVANDAIVQNITSLTAWEPRQLIRLANYFRSYFVAQAFNPVEQLGRFQQCFALAQMIQVDIDFLLQLADTSQLDLSTNYAFYRQQADALLKVLRAHYSEEEWKTVYKPIQSRLAMQKRDALLGLAMRKLKLSPQFQGRKDPDILYEYFLLDMQIGGEVETSRIVQATASLQLYVQRCLMNLEAGVNPNKIPLAEWEWVKNYRVWEANRKVFLYPENYIEPELRDTKTPFFEDLEQELMQTDINLDSVEQAYLHYLEKFKEVATLKIVGSYFHEGVDESGNITGDKLLYLIGRTSTDPQIYYYRIYNFSKKQWLPWNKIELTIASNFAVPVFAFNKLFLFWSEIKKVSKSVDRKPTTEDERRKAQNEGLLDSEGYLLVNKGMPGRVQENIEAYTVAVKYSYLNFSGMWIQPQTYFEFPNTLREDEYVRPEWQRVYAQRTLKFFEQQPTQTQTTEIADVLQIDDRTDIKLLPSLRTSDRLPWSMNQLTWSFWVYCKRNSSAGNTELNVFYYDNTTDQPYPFVVKLNNNRAESPSYRLVQKVITVIDNAAQLAETALSQANRLKTDTTTTSRDNLARDFRATLNSLKPKLEEIRESIIVATGLFNDKSLVISVTNKVDSITQLIDKVEIVSDKFDDTFINDVTTIRNLIRNSTQPSTDDLLSITVSAGGKSENASYITLMIHADQRNVGRSEFGYEKWHHVALTLSWNSAQNKYDLKQFIDGKETLVLDDNSAAQTVLSYGGHRLPLNADLIIGQRNTSPPNQQPFHVYLSEFQVWNRVRSASEIENRKNIRIPVGSDGLFTTEKEAVFVVPLNTGTTGRTRVNSSGIAGSSGDAQSPSALKFTQNQITLIENRERVLIFYGDRIGSFNESLDDQKFTLELKTSPPGTASIASRLPSYDLDLSSSKLVITETNGLSFNDYAKNSYSTVNRYLPENWRRLSEIVKESGSSGQFREDKDFISRLLSSSGANFPILNDVSLFEAALMDVNNQPGWYILSTSDEQLLIKIDSLSPKTARERLTFQYVSNIGGSDTPQPLWVSFSEDTALQKPPGQSGAPTFKLKFERLSTHAVHQLSLNLFRGGVDELLSLNSQQAPEWAFERYDPTSSAIAPSSNNSIDFDGAHGIYYWEIFFHIPFLIANRLNANQNFADAQKWYHYIFNPSAQNGSQALSNPNDRYWQFIKFRNLTAKDTLDKILSNEAALARYYDDPFDPHAIAALRMNAYQKAIVMKYIDNLLDWGDSLFMQDTRESVNESIMLYVLAYNLLGPRPSSKVVKELDPIGTYGDIKQKYQGDIPDFVVDLLTQNGSSIPNRTLTPHTYIITNFCVPENEKFIGYWDRVADRLFKIRHSQNFEGTFRQLALFEPPIDPMALVQAISRGGSVSGAVASLSLPVPHYRYGFMIDKAKDMVSTVMDFGSALLSAIENRDAAKLEMLQNTQERAILNLTTSIKQWERDQAQQAIEGLEITKESITKRRDRFQSLYNENLIPEEIKEMLLFQVSQYGMRPLGTTLQVVAGFLGSGPTAVTGLVGPLPLANVAIDGDTRTAMAQAGSDVAFAIADLLEAVGAMTAKMGEYKRRRGEWKFEKEIAGKELEEIDKQIASARAQLAIAEREIAIHNKTIEQNQEIAAFYRNKFSNQDLYSWMISRLTNLYRQAYNLAFDMAKSAERAMQYELPSIDTFITPSHWNSAKQGLLAGESLMLELMRMEKYQLSQDSRFQEIDKFISMKKTFSVALLLLLTTGSCELELSEFLFNLDFPGHYFRVIKTMGISLQVTLKNGKEHDPYESAKISLIQLSSKALLSPDSKAVKYLMTGEGTPPDQSTLRVNWRANQQIAVCSTVNEEGTSEEVNGMFNLDFIFDNRYFPFEGTGAISRWRLEMLQETNASFLEIYNIVDISIHVRYTSKVERGSFRNDVLGYMKDLRGV